MGIFGFGFGVVGQYFLFVFGVDQWVVVGVVVVWMVEFDCFGFEFQGLDEFFENWLFDINVFGVQVDLFGIQEN